MALLNITDAEGIAGRGRPWTIRLEFHGSNPNNASGSSHKYWYATGRGLNEKVETGWGAIGSAPQHQLLDWPDLRIKVTEKLAKGYQWAATPYIRMTAASLALLSGNPPPVAPMPPKPVQTPPKVKPVQTPSATPNQTLQAMGVPYSLICTLKMVRTGTKVTGYKALDASGDEVLDFDAATGLAFAQKHNIDIDFN